MSPSDAAIRSYNICLRLRYHGVMGLIYLMLLSLPIWLPVVFLAIAIRRKVVGIGFLSIFIVFELVAIAVSWSLVVLARFNGVY